MAVSRRGLLGGALTVAALAATKAAALPSSAWVSYESRLQSRLRDAGGGSFADSQGRALLKSTNAFRQQHGLGAYAWDADLAECARAHAADMAQRGYFAHNSPEGFRSNARASLLARDFCGPTAENLAWRSGEAQARDFQQMWERSPGHRANLLHPTCTMAGYGVVHIAGRSYATAVYGRPTVRLAENLRFHASQSDLDRVVRSPHMQRVGFSRPGERLGALPPKRTSAPALQPGVWQLQTVAPAGGRAYDVLPGPVFMI